MYYNMASSTVTVTPAAELIHSLEAAKAVSVQQEELVCDAKKPFTQLCCTPGVVIGQSLVFYTIRCLL